VSDGSSPDATEIDVAMFDDDMKIAEYVTIAAG
jgi:hypothetical protein